MEDDGGASEAEVYLSEDGDSGFKVSYSSQTNQLQFIPRVVGADQSVALMIERSNGNVGIGTTTPDSKLEVTDTIRVSRPGVPQQRIEIASPGAQGLFLTARSSEGDKKPLVIQSVHDGAGSPDGFTDIIFRTGIESGPTTEIMRLTESGNVGIGTTSPNAKLEVTGTIHSTSGGFKFPDGTVQSSAAIATVGTGARNPLQIALLRWYEANESGVTFSVGNSPFGVAFDGANIWVANAGSNYVTKLRASDGAVLGTFTVGSVPTGVAFDGANIWVTSLIGIVTKLRASDGTPLGTFLVGTSPEGVAFDGANIWVTNGGSNTVTKLRASDGAVLGTFNVGSSPNAVAFDGANIWVTNFLGDNVTKL